MTPKRATKSSVWLLSCTSGFRTRSGLSKFCGTSRASMSAMSLIRFRWNRFGPMYAVKIRRNRVSRVRIREMAAAFGQVFHQDHRRDALSMARRGLRSRSSGIVFHEALTSQSSATYHCKDFDGQSILQFEDFHAFFTFDGPFSDTQVQPLDRPPIKTNPLSANSMYLKGNPFHVINAVKAPAARIAPLRVLGIERT